MPELVLTYDMRAPEFGASRNDLFDAALDQAAWADELGFDLIGLGEHHCSEDGYNPSPLILASAIAARTRQIRIRTSVLLAPFYDPIKLAEDLAVLQTLSRGRLIAGLGAGYRAVEFESFGRRLEDRWRVMGEIIGLLKQAWTGEPFEYEGRSCRVTPAPEPRAPEILLGGSSPAAARRAARIADGWLPPLDPALWSPYRDECIAIGKPDPGSYPAQGPIFLWVSENPDDDWKWLMPHILHQLRSYASWTAESFGKPAGPYAEAVTEDTVRESAVYRVLSPEETLELANELGEPAVLYLSPLLAGIDPRRAEPMLRRFEDHVHPYLNRPARFDAE